MSYQIIHMYFSQGSSSIILSKEEDTPYHLFSLYLQGDWFPILSLCLLQTTQKNYWETHVSALDKQYRNKGYGKAIYEFAIQYAIKNNIKLCSSMLASESAKNVWDSLSKKYNIQYYYGQFYLC